jgi:small subunit ribosomal protein S20
MPNTTSAKKRLRLSERRRVINRPWRTVARSAVRRARELIAAADLAGAGEAVRRAYRMLDKAAKRGVIHRNNASRRKSRLAHRLNALRGRTS